MICIKGTIIQKQKVADGIYSLKVKCPDVVRATLPGQYVILKTEDGGSYPTFITEDGKDKFIVTFEEESENGEVLIKLKKGDSFPVVVGPLGQPLIPKEMGNVCIVTDHGSVGPFLRMAQMYKHAGNRVYFITCFKHKKQKHWESKVKKSADKHSFVVEKKNSVSIHPLLKEVNNLLRRKHINLMISSCDLEMQRQLTQVSKLRTTLLTSVLPIIHEGMGMCGRCRLSLDGETKLSCVEGPFLNAHKLDWQEIINRANRGPCCKTEAKNE